MKKFFVLFNFLACFYTYAEAHQSAQLARVTMMLIAKKMPQLRQYGIEKEGIKAIQRIIKVSERPMSRRVIFPYSKEKLHTLENKLLEAESDIVVNILPAFIASSPQFFEAYAYNLRKHVHISKNYESYKEAIKNFKKLEINQT